MIINATKKALPIFNKLVTVDSTADATNFATANPLFSWHANYYSSDHKKIVVLINDLTFATVILYDVNSRNKGHLEHYITDGVRKAFQLADIPESKIEAYVKMAGKIKINTGFNRQVTSVMTNAISILDNRTFLDTKVMIQSKLMNLLMGIPHKQKNYNNAKQLLTAAFQNDLAIVAPTNIEYQITKSWADFSQWNKYYTDQSLINSTEKYDQITAEVQANNSFLLSEFANYLSLSKKLSLPVVKRHVANVDFFINQFLLYFEIKTPKQTVNEVFAYLSDWFPRKVADSLSEIKYNATSLKKFLEFMKVAGEISTEDEKLGKLNIKEGVEIGTDHWHDLNILLDDY